MKTLYLVGGTMGVGKTTACQELKKLLPHSVFLDGDWCWDADPFVVTEETMAMVRQNICFLLNQFLRCSVYENVILCWVMHQQEIIDSLLAELDRSRCAVRAISLVCTEDTLRQRLGGDVAAGRRTADVIERSVARLPLYGALRTLRVPTDGKSPREVAESLAALGKAPPAAP